MYLHELLTGSEVYAEPLKFPEKVGANLFDANITCILFYLKSKDNIIRKLPGMQCTHTTKGETVKK